MKQCFAHILLHAEAATEYLNHCFTANMWLPTRRGNDHNMSHCHQTGMYFNIIQASSFLVWNVKTKATRVKRTVAVSFHAKGGKPFKISYN